MSSLPQVKGWDFWLDLSFHQHCSRVLLFRCADEHLKMFLVSQILSYLCSWTVNKTFFNHTKPHPILTHIFKILPFCLYFHKEVLSEFWERHTGKSLWVLHPPWLRRPSHIFVVSQFRWNTQDQFSVQKSCTSEQAAARNSVITKPTRHFAFARGQPWYLSLPR